MNRSAKSLAVACAGSFALLGAVTAANADYPGYGGGAPGPADVWASQHSGGAVTHEHQHSAAVNGGCAYLHHKAMQTGSSYWWHRFEKCENS